MKKSRQQIKHRDELIFTNIITALFMVVLMVAGYYFLVFDKTIIEEITVKKIDKFNEHENVYLIEMVYENNFDMYMLPLITLEFDDNCISLVDYYTPNKIKYEKNNMIKQGFMLKLNNNTKQCKDYALNEQIKIIMNTGRTMKLENIKLENNDNIKNLCKNNGFDFDKINPNTMEFECCQTIGVGAYCVNVNKIQNNQTVMRN